MLRFNLILEWQGCIANDCGCIWRRNKSVISEFSIKQNNERKILSENNLKICKNNMDIEYENGKVKFLSEPLCPDKYAYIYEQVDKLEQVD